MIKIKSNRAFLRRILITIMIVIPVLVVMFFGSMATIALTTPSFVKINLHLVNEDGDPMSNCYVGEHTDEQNKPNWGKRRFNYSTSGVGFVGPALNRSIHYDFIGIVPVVHYYYHTDDNGNIAVNISKYDLEDSLSYRLGIRIQCESGSMTGSTLTGIRLLGIRFNANPYVITMKTVEGNPSGSSSSQWIEESFVKDDKIKYGTNDKLVKYKMTSTIS